MINFLTITDPHLSGKGPNAYLPNPGAYKQDILAILSECADLAREHNCSFVAIPGDVTDTHMMSDRVKTEFIEAINMFPCPVVAIDGNHCKETTNREDLKAAPYGVFRASKVFRDAYDKPFVSLDYKFAVTGHPYDENTDWDISQYCIGERLGQVTIHLTHGMLLPEPPWWAKSTRNTEEDYSETEKPKMRYTTFEQLAQLPVGSLPDIIVNGHYHAGHEAFYLPNGTLVVNYGAVCRLSRSLEEIKRVLRVGLITIEGPGENGKARYKAEPIILKSQRPGHECLDREELVRELERAKNKEKMNEYLSLLGTKREIRTRDAKEVIKESVKELGKEGKLPGGVSGSVVEGRCLVRLDKVSRGMEAKEVGVS